MLEDFEKALFCLLPDVREVGLDRGNSLSSEARRLNTAFLTALCGGAHPSGAQASETLKDASRAGPLRNAALFYLEGLGRIRGEIASRMENDPAFSSQVKDLALLLEKPSSPEDPWALAEAAWKVFFPEGAGIAGRREDGVRRLRDRRTVAVTDLNQKPVEDPGREVLFTSNVLLTLPSSMDLLDRLPAPISKRVRPVFDEPQTAWYDHPVRIGTAPENNEILYGLKGLNEAAAFEKARGNLGPNDRAVCLLSVSLTHPGLHAVAGDYIRGEIQKAGGLEHLRVFAFTEADTRRLAEEVLCPAANRFLGGSHPAAAFPEVFGVDGEYGRHYTFLKAVAPLWRILVDRNVRATFKIDLDQIFPQEILVLETGASAFEHLKNPLWGARGRDFQGRKVELGLLAGALVNDSDIHKGLFTPDVPFPRAAPEGEGRIFFSTLPQALSTEAEMTARGFKSRTRCLQRIHVTGGTTGALVRTLRKFRPFTPSFVGRAEDQAFILSSLAAAGPRPAYLHAPGLIMRHDKESFAADAVHAARVSKLIGDYIRVLVFSSYARLLEDPPVTLKETLDPFTGCFITRIPRTIVHLRLAFQAHGFFEKGSGEDGLRLVREGAERLGKALAFVDGEDSRLKQVFRQEKRGWDVYYDTLDALEEALDRGDRDAQKIRAKARKIVRECALTP